MKRSIFLVTILILAVLLSSCVTKSDSVNGQGDPGKDPGLPKEEELLNQDYERTGMLPAVKKPVTLKALARELPDTDPSTHLHTIAYEEMTGIKIEWDYISLAQDFNTIYNLMIASKEYPDIIFNGLSVSQVSLGIEGNVLLPLNSLIEKYGYHYKEVLKEHPEYKTYLTAPDGNIYTFLYTDVGVHKDSEYKMWVYDEWLDKLDIKMPANTQEFKEMLIAFRDKDPNENGIADEIPLAGFFGGRKTDPICFLMNPFQLYEDNYYYISDTGNIEFIANTEGWREGLRYLNNLYKEGLILEETYVQDQTQFKSLLNRPAGETILGTFPGWYQGAFIDLDVVDWTDYAPVPPIEGPTGLRQTSARKGGGFALTCAITTQCKNPEAAFIWFDWLLSEEGGFFGSHGVEGITYEWVEQESFNGTSPSISVIPLKENEKKQLWDASSYPRYDRPEIRFGRTEDRTRRNIDNTYVLLSGAMAYEPFYVWHNKPQILWTSDPDVDTDKIEFQTLFDDYISSNSTAFILGNLDINNDGDWNAYTKELERMGLKEYMKLLEVYFNLK